MKSDKSTPNVPTLRFPDFSEEWRSTPMKNVCSFAKGYGIAKENLSAEGTPCILYGELYTYYKTAIAKDIRSKTQLDPTDLFHSKANDVIIPCSGETAIDIATSVCVPYDDVLLGGDLTVIRTKLNGAFLSNQLNSVRRKKIATIAQGASIVHLHADELKKINITYPTSEEQDKIAHFIDCLDERIATQNKIISKYESLIKGIEDSVLSVFESVEYQLGDLVQIVKGQQINGLQLESTGDYYYLNGGISPSGYVNKYNAEENTISISEGGNSCGFVRFNTEKFWSGGHCYTLKIKNAFCCVKYLFYYLKSNEKDIMQLRVGSGLPNIQKGSLAGFPVKLPRLQMQQSIVRVLDALTNKKEIEIALLKQLQSQKTYLLSKMFI